jgi:uncharacterized protein (UPF0276 family)
VLGQRLLRDGGRQVGALACFTGGCSRGACRNGISAGGTIRARHDRGGARHHAAGCCRTDRPVDERQRGSGRRWQAARQSAGQEGVAAQGGSRRGSELRGGDVLGGHEEKNSVNESGGEIAGVGLGLRWEFLDELIEASASRTLPIDFLEISPENYMRRGGRYPAALGWLAERYPIITHGLTMSLGGIDPLDDGYLGDLAAFLREMGTPWHSDHLCFGSVDGRVLHDLLPVAFTEATVTRVAERIRRARDAIGRPLAVENISYYWHPGRAEMRESELLARVCDAADCGLLLDVNNAYVNAANFGFAVDAWIREAPLERVVQIHVAGHEWFAVDDRGIGEPASARSPGAMIVDTHGADVPDPVLSLLGQVLERTGSVPVVLERDQNVPSLDALLDELGRVRAICSAAAYRRQAAPR